MTERTILLIVACALVGGALFHLSRLFWHISLSVGSVYFPPWTGGLFFVFYGLLAAGLFKVLFGASFPSTPSDP